MPDDWTPQHHFFEVKHIEVLIDGEIKPAHLMLCDYCYQVEWHCFWLEGDLGRGRGRVCNRGNGFCEEPPEGADA